MNDDLRRLLAQVNINRANAAQNVPGNNINRGPNHNTNANRGAYPRPQNNRPNRGANVNQGQRGGNRGNHVNRGGNRGNHHNQGENHPGTSGNRGNHHNRGGNNFGNRGNRRPSRNVSAARPQTPDMDWFNMQPRTGMNRAHSVDNVMHSNAPRPDYGGRYTSNRDQNQRNPEQNQERGDRRGFDRNSRDPRNIGFKFLTDMCDMEPDKVICILLKEEVGFDKLIKTDLTPDYIILILRVVRKICDSAFTQNTGKILSLVCEPDFVNKITRYIQDINLQEAYEKNRNKYLWNDMDQFLECLITIYESILKLKPTTACEVLPKLLTATVVTVSSLNSIHNVIVPDRVKEKMEDLQMKLLLCKEEREKKIKNYENDEVNYEPPPNDFRLINLYPTVEEITAREEVYKRPIIVKGKYNSVEHYLDVQFRLLREDFIAPLREGICTYMDQLQTKDKKRIYDVRMYPKSRFIKSENENGKVIRIVQFNNDPKKNKIRLENSRRFMFGSLVCFTKDRFQNVIFGTIADRKIELLKNGRIGVDLLGTFDYNEDYIMVECSVYFEPYYHVLKALQIMDTETFPLEKYIIDVSTDIQPPAYFGINSILNQSSRGITIPVLQNDHWPSAEKLGLDNSQFNAFKSALTREFCVIQGPPGTGKTYIGLRIAEILLENARYWNYYGPMLVICFTNHALDQFLEGITEFTDKVVRVGGQSKNKKLAPFNIRELRTKKHRERFTGAALFQKRDELRAAIVKINTVQKMIDVICAHDTIIDVNVFEDIDPQLSNSWFSRHKKSDILDWLLGGHNVEQRMQERQRMRAVEIPVINQNEDEESDDSDEFLDAEEMGEDRVIDDGDKLEVEVEAISYYRMTLASVKSLQEKYAALEKELENIEDPPDNYILFNPKIAKIEEAEKAMAELNYVQYRLDQHKHNQHPPPPLNVDYTDPTILTPNERWGLYWKWINTYYASLLNKTNRLEINYRRIFQEYEEIKSMEDIRLMKSMSVVGMTTTGAARYQTILQALKCPIVIVEEAAEVLESHVVVSLTSDCQHLILIGDHKQLRPTTAVYHLATKYNLEISLFERMVRNNVHCQTLEVQHRMKPEIARLIVPAIYPKLENHISVHAYPPIQGITSNLFFLTHTEEETVVADSSSRKNIHEAKFMINLARHLILQGYEPSDITILATYSGQMFCLWHERKNYPLLQDVHITVVDNFQGEENKIILLSLVRSNAEENIGFLKTDNRVCVALSRAREALFIMGNMDILVKKNNIWPQIKSALEENNSLGTYLTLKCQIHPDQKTLVQMPNDFLKVSEGGCTLICGKQLDCSHICTSLCHITDREHIEYACKEPCIKTLCELGHQCPDLCYKQCQPCMVPMQVILKCGHMHYLPCHEDPSKFQCPTLIEVELECGHKANKPCHRDIKTYPCPHPCEIRRLCGHTCDKLCHINSDPDHLESKCFKPCGKYRENCSTQTHNCQLKCYEDCPPCDVKIKKHRTICKHVLDVKCSEDVDKLVCEKRCDRKMDCGHLCKLKCCEPCGNCKVNVEKEHPICRHKLKVICCEEPNRKQCTGKCPLILPCQHPCQAKCNQECTKLCTHLVDSPIKAACGHEFKIPCFKKDKINSSTSFHLLKHCPEPCNATLDCLHKCVGTCGKCAQGRIHSSCQAQCGASLICGHDCEIPCRETCQPCNKKCAYKCAHSKCGKKCGEPCTNCTEPCERRCDHVRCNKRCGEMCSVDPCKEPCPLSLPCGHPCIGFCGDVCPPVCRECNADDVTFEVFFGDEDEPDARFVYLEECKHSIESEAMDNWLKEGNHEINVKRCPKCKTSITKTQRYSNYIKVAYKNIIEVKTKQFGNPKENEEMRLRLLKEISVLASLDRQLLSYSKPLSKILTNMQNLLQTTFKGNRQTVSKVVMNTFEAQIQIVDRIVRIYKKCDLKNMDNVKKCSEHANFLLELLSKQNNRITKQEVSDFQLEIQRFEKFVQVCKIEADACFKIVVTKVPVKILHTNIWDSINSTRKYSTDQDTYLTANIKALRELVNKSMEVTPEEKQMINKAMGMSQGHWFKCPNGHTYCIGECGGAMEESKCNECGARIGGSSHRLLSTNRHDGSMDGSSRAAWSDAANMDMRNFVL